MRSIKVFTSFSFLSKYSERHIGQPIAETSRGNPYNSLTKDLSIIFLRHSKKGLDLLKDIISRLLLNVNSVNNKKYFSDDQTSFSITFPKDLTDGRKKSGKIGGFSEN